MQIYNEDGRTYPGRTVRCMREQRLNWLDWPAVAVSLVGRRVKPGWTVGVVRGDASQPKGLRGSTVAGGDCAWEVPALRWERKSNTEEMDVDKQSTQKQWLKFSKDLEWVRPRKWSLMTQIQMKIPFLETHSLYWQMLSAGTWYDIEQSNFLSLCF